jgi:Na+/H+-dicarboxylate symporter
MNVFRLWGRISLVNQLLLAMIVGAFLGLIFGNSIVVIKPLGTIFLNLLRMAALPLIIFSLVAGMTSVSEVGTLGRLGTKIIIYYLVTTALATAVGVLAGELLEPGAGFVLQDKFEVKTAKIPTFGDAIVGMIPSNIFAALSGGSYDQAVVFSLFIGIGALILPAQQRVRIHDIFQLLADLMGHVVKIIMYYAPIGVGALIACAVGVYGPMFFTFAAKFVAANYLAVFVMIIFYALLLIVFSRRNPWSVFKQARLSMITAFSTCSSAATLPSNLDSANRIGVRKEVSSFTISLGVQLGKDGTGILLALSVLFAAQAAGIQIGLANMFQIVFLGLLLTTGSSVVAGGAIVVVTIIVQSFGLPVETVAVVAGALALVDGILTLSNTLVDLVGAVLVSDSEDRRDRRLAEKN